MGKRIETYSLGVLVEAKATDAINALKGVDAQAGRVSKDFATLEKQSASSARGVGTHWKNALSGSTFTTLNLSGKQAFSKLEQDAQRTGSRLKQLLTVKASISGDGGGMASMLGGGGGFGGGSGMMRGLMGKITKMGAGRIALAGTGIGAAVSAGLLLKDAADFIGETIIPTGLDFNETVESAQIGLERLLGSTEKAAAHIEDLKQAAKVAPTGFESLLELDQQLQNAGYSAEGLPKELADVATGIGQLAGTKGLDDRMQRVIAQITQMANVGKAQFEDLKIIAENGIPVFQLLGDAIGKSKKEVIAMARDGALDGKGTGEVILEQIAKVGRANAEKIQKSAAVLKSNLEDSFTQLAGRATQNVFKAQNEGIATLLSGEGLAAGLAAKADDLAGKFTDPLIQVFKALQTGNFSGAGSAIVEGVAKGIKESAAEVIKAGGSIAESAYQGLKDAAGINSPALKFVPLGMGINEGVAKGISESGSVIDAALGVVIDRAIQHGLTKAQAKVQFDRAKENLGDFQKAADTSGYDISTILGIASRESNIKNIIGDHGRGVGMMQVDIGTDAAFKASGAWKDTGRAIERGGEILKSKINQLIALAGKEVTIKDRKGRSYTFTVPKLEGEQLKQTAIASYNSGLWAAYHVSKGRSPDYGTTGKDYSADVLARAGQFRAMLGGKIPPAQTSGFSLSMAERYALYHPGAASPAMATLPFPSSLKALETGSAATKPTSAKLVDLVAYKTEVNENTASLVKLAEVNEQLLKLDTTRLEASRAELAAAKARVYQAEEGYGKSVFDSSGSDYRTDRSVEDNRNKVGGGGKRKTLFGDSAPITQFSLEDSETGKGTGAAAAGLRAVGKEAKSLMSGAFGQLSNGVGQMVSDWVLLGETGPAALKKLTAQVLASVSAEAAVKAIYYLAEGFAALVWNPPAAGKYFTAAALMGSIAIGTGLAGRALAGNSFKNQNGGGNSSGSNAQVGSEGYAGNRFAYNSIYGANGNARIEFLLQQLNNKITPTNGDTLVVGAIKRNSQVIGSATVEAINNNDALSRRLGQRIN